MKLSKNTLKILKNFVKINASLRFKEGNLITTSTDDKVVIAQAEVEEYFPRDFNIYVLTEFLSVIETLEEPTLEFGEKSVIISSGQYEVDYIYASNKMNGPAIGQIQNKPQPVVEFKLPKTTCDDIKNLSASLGTDELHIVGDGERIHMLLKNSSGAYANKAKIDCNKKFDKKFTAILGMRQLIQIPDDYTVGVLSKSGIHFSSDNSKLDYWLALMSTSSMRELQK